MKTTSLKFINDDLHKVLLPLLEDTIFHMSTQEAYRQIIEDGKIKNNRDGQYQLNAMSDNSFGRKRGYICLFNFKDHDRAIVKETLVDYYYFLDPDWFRRYYEDRVESKLAYFILHSKCYHLIIGNEVAKESGDQYVPKTECWMENEISLDHIDNVLLATVINSIPTDPFLHAHHMLSLERQNEENNSG
mgnify:CR=1 FL=1|jgi:hypothetical protein